ncbi:hypothetical protein D3C84_195570 [compost metagenome]
MDKKLTSYQVSQEFLGTGLLVTAGIGLLAKYTPQVVAALTNKISDKAAGEVIKKAKTVLAGSKEGDLVRFTQSARVEPILLMDKRAVNIPFIQDVVHTAYNMFTGYWLLAVSLDCKINGVSVGRRLDKFATDRDLNEATLTMMTEGPSMESFAASMADFGLPFIDEILAQDHQVAMESVSDGSMVAASIQADVLDDEPDTRTPAQKKAEDMQNERRQKQADASDADAAKRAQAKEDEAERNAKMKNGTGVTNAAKYVEKVNNLAVGNVIDVTISEDGKDAVVPVTIRLRVASMPSDVMTQTLAVGGTDVTMRSRWRAWRAGEIGFWSDFVLQMDRVDAHRAAMMKDETGYYKTVYARAAKNSAAAAMAGGPSLGTASAILVLDVKTAQELERRIGGQLSNFKTRQGIFGHTYSMLMIIVDPDWESVTIYTRGIEMPSKLSKNDIKSSGKSDSKELMDILKSYQLGKAPGRI